MSTETVALDPQATTAEPPRKKRGAPRKPNALKGQINVRIDADVKARADAAFAAAGLSASKVIRDIYYRASNGELPPLPSSLPSDEEALPSMLSLSEEEREERFPKYGEYKKTLRLIDGLIVRDADATGDCREVRSWEEMRDDAYTQRAIEKGWIVA